MPRFCNNSESEVAWREQPDVHIDLDLSVLSRIGNKNAVVGNRALNRLRNVLFFA